MTSLLSRVQGCLLGVQIGDAMGMPWEIRSHQEILDATNDLGVTTFCDAGDHRFDSLKGFKAGDTTDDWQLTRANIKALILDGQYDQIGMALWHIAAFEETTAGWGGATRRGVAEVREYFNSDHQRGRSPFIRPQFKEGEGSGNGVAMKIAPIALYNWLRDGQFRPTKLWLNTMDHGNLTHYDIRASVGAYAIALVISLVLGKQFPAGDEKVIHFFMDSLYQMVRQAEESFPEQKYDLNVSDQLRRIQQGRMWNDPEALRTAIGTSCFTPQSVPFAIGTFLRYPTDFRAGVLEAVNAGGDTDSNAAMVGAMIGANVGLEGIPEEWRNFRPEFQESIELGQQLYEVALSARR